MVNLLYGVEDFLHANFDSVSISSRTVIVLVAYWNCLEVIKMLTPGSLAKKVLYIWSGFGIFKKISSSNSNVT
jgi:hypothetical protein